ncbi:uncharacterized protein [Drosophila pseudoobscura]|uniref:Uncharacterized protein n=1 Tax=Drosophila pseudoobscura pseudoobscura TaxID=46245 RepID=A0A6I8UBB7_DROPS|nr:uncharacterized protein LOC4812019 [Drosophila pseudoobscura]
MKCHLLLLQLGLLGLACVHGAQVYMQFNGHGYSYNTDIDRAGRSVLSPKYGQAAGPINSLELSGPLQFVQQSLRYRESPTAGSSYNSHPTADSVATSSLSRGYQTYPSPNLNLNSNSFQQAAPSFDFSTHQMSHAQRTDEAGNVLGKYSYYDEAGYHELSYKAGAGIGFVVMGGNLAKATATADPQSEIGIQTNALSPTSANFQELHKYGTNT